MFKIKNVNYELLRELEIIDYMKELKNKKEIVFGLQKQASDLDELRRLCHEFGISYSDLEAILEAQEIKTEESIDVKAKILELIENLDSGEGSDYSKIIEQSDLPEDVIDSTIQELLEEGSCFEPRPGRIKKL